MLLFCHLLHRRVLYPLRLDCCSVPGVLSASSSHVRSSSVDVVQLGGGVTTRGWSVCVRWSRLLGFCREFLKLLAGTKARRGGAYSVFSAPRVLWSIVVVQWRRCRLWPVPRVARMLLSISLPLLGCLSRSIFLVRLAAIVSCPLSCFVRGIRVSIDFESPSCLGVLKIVQAVHERFSPCSSGAGYSGGVMGVPGIRGNEVNLTVPWSTLMVENNFRFLKILKST
ncbi:hypothetical protein DY000_02059557 [Brassica cretica]|uniref:Uncharacterized protein n=1 Tax=Brassica cretica TaxID=69181 RepID=A0ABQ7AZS0_BRACR|nr:hypothetical protein DY000_02059557 [Brassica cretica]